MNIGWINKLKHIYSVSYMQWQWTNDWYIKNDAWACPVWLNGGALTYEPGNHSSFPDQGTSLGVGLIPTEGMQEAVNQ